MCGIAGWVGFTDLGRARQQVAVMTDDLSRRGPDAAGLECWPSAVLGHRRLSIFDLSDAGRQPMMSADRQVAVVFNGAIYNFRDLRAQLEQLGCVFHTETDTEVLLHGYRQWGIEPLVSRLRGMFAMALWDAGREVVFLVRDRLGVKPLVFSEQSGSIAFASTVRALHRAGFGGTVDPGSVLEFLEFGYITDRRSIYHGIRKVPAGALIRFDVATGTSSESRYWTPPRIQGRPAPAMAFEEAVDEVERRLLDAVKLRLAADVKVAALLSGGIDSGLVCWAIREAGGNLTAYTVGVPGDADDESGAAAVTARTLGITQELLPIDPASAPEPADLTAAFGEPFACSSALGMLAVSKMVASNATVLLTGDGGDDVFLGYPEHRHFLMAQKAASRIPAPLLRGWQAVPRGWPAAGPLKRARTFADVVAGGLAAVATVHDGLPNYGSMLNGRLRGLTIPQREMPWPREGGRTLLEDFLRYDFDQRFTGEYLPKVDGATMFYALEARSPFLDHELWSFAATLPFELRLRDNRPKAVLRAIAARRIGAGVSALPKRGFTIPAERWITTKWRPQFEALFERPRLADEGFIDLGAVKKEFSRAAAEQRSHKQLWHLFVLENWLRAAA